MPGSRSGQPVTRAPLARRVLAKTTLGTAAFLLEVTICAKATPGAYKLKPPCSPDGVLSSLVGLALRGWLPWASRLFARASVYGKISEGQAGRFVCIRPPGSRRSITSSTRTIDENNQQRHGGPVPQRSLEVSGALRRSTEASRGLRGPENFVLVRAAGAG